MFKTILRIYLGVYFVSVAGMGNAEPLPQAAFKIVNGTGGRTNSGGASSSVALPVLSFLVDSTHELRPMIGIAGSASVGTPLDFGFDVTQAATPPGHDYILATTSGSNWPLLLQVHGDTITVQSTDSLVQQRHTQSGCSGPDDVSFQRLERLDRLGCEVAPSPVDEATTIDRIALSPAGSAAAFFSESQHRIYVFTNLAQSPVLLGEYQVGELGSVSALGISDDGRTIAAGVSDGDTGSLFLINAGGPARLIASIRHPSVITFLHNSDGAIIADDLENKVYALSGGQVFPIASAENGISKPIGIGVSNDNRRIFVGNSQSGSVTTIDPYEPVAEPRFCDCNLTGLHPTNTDSVFRLTDFSGGPVLLFDGNVAGPRILFVPMRSQF